MKTGAQIKFKTLKLALCVALSLTLLACDQRKPDINKMMIFGSINEDNWVTTDDLRKLTHRELEEQFLGKVITISRFKLGSKLGYYGGKNSNRCIILYNERARQEIRESDTPTVSVSAYINNIEDYKIAETIDGDPSLVSYDNIADLPKSFCSADCEWDAAAPSACPNKSPTTVISGKVFGTYRGEKSIHFDLRAGGVAITRK